MDTVASSSDPTDVSFGKQIASCLRRDDDENLTTSTKIRCLSLAHFVIIRRPKREMRHATENTKIAVQRQK